MDEYDFSGFPSMGDSVRIAESYAPSRYSMRFKDEEFADMTKSELLQSKKSILKQIKDLEKELGDRESYNKTSYIIQERIDYELKLLDDIENRLAKMEADAKEEKGDRYDRCKRSDE